MPSGVRGGAAMDDVVSATLRMPSTALRSREDDGREIGRPVQRTGGR
jgi:hypothetical protein